MARNRESEPSTPIQITPNLIAPGSELHGAVRRALYSRRGWLRAGVLVAGFTGTMPLASAAPFPPILPLASLFPAGGGDGSAGFVLTGIDTGDLSGQSVSAAGDVNGDGIDDLIVGARFADAGGDYGAGESYVVFGSTQGFPAVLPLATLFPAGGGDGSVGFVLSGIDFFDNAGYAVSGAGDVNRDGIKDLIVGAQYADPGGHSRAGESYVAFG